MTSSVKNILLFTLLIMAGFFFFWQGKNAGAIKKKKEHQAIYDSISERVLLRSEFAGGLLLHSRGWGLHFRKGRNISFFKSLHWEVDAVSMKSPKQIKTINPYFTNSKSYVYGKLNYMYVVRAGLGYKRLLNRKPYWGGVELRFSYFGGFSLALAKPVYLYIMNYSVETDDFTIDIEKYNSTIHGLDNIYGRAPFTHGIGNTTLHPGLYLKTGLNFEFGEYNTSVKAVEVGAILDYYPIPVAIMAYEPKQSFFLTFYLGFSIGKRYD